MLDLHGAVMDDNTLDHQLQDSLALGNTRGLQPRPYPLAEGTQARQGLLGLDALLS